MHINTTSRRQVGSTLVAVLITSGVLFAITTSLLTVALNRRQVVNQSSVWQESLIAAEAGVHQGVAQLERALSLDSLPANPSTGVGQTFTVDLPHVGEDSSSASARYTLTRNDVSSGGMIRPYYSIVSTGIVTLPGSRTISRDSRDTILRKLNIVRMAAGTTKRSATRTVEAWVKPRYNTDAALRADGAITLNNHNIYVDSFNSTDPTRSLTGGLPGTTIGQFNVSPFNIMQANVATNSQFLEAGNAQIYGDVLTNGGTVGNTAGIQGEIRDDYFEPMAPVYPPSWSTTTTVGIPTINKPNQLTSKVTTSATLRGGTASNPARYIVDSVKLSGTSDKILFDLGLTSSGTPDPTKGYVEIYVRGDFTTNGGGTGDGSVEIVNGVSVKMWVLGSLTFSGNGMTNNNGLASTFSLYSVNAPTPTSGQTVTLSGSSRFYGTVYAPGADLKLGGGGSDGTFVGSLAGKTAYMNGDTSIRYDEALSQQGLITRFVIVSWFEDTKKQGAFPGTL